MPGRAHASRARASTLLRRDGLVVIRAVRHAELGVEQAQVVRDLGHRRDGRLRARARWCAARARSTAGRPSTASTSGRGMVGRNWRAYGVSVSRKRRWPSAKTTSNASVLLPEPLGPVTTVSAPWGIATRHVVEVVLAGARDGERGLRWNVLRAARVWRGVVRRAARAAPAPCACRSRAPPPACRAATTRPPSAPAPGPRSMTKSAARDARRGRDRRRARCRPPRRSRRGRRARARPRRRGAPRSARRGRAAARRARRRARARA